MKKLLLIITTIASLFSLPVSVLAGSGGGASTVTNQLKCSTVAGTEGINTAIGCIPYGNREQFLRVILTWAIGIGGGIFLILAGFAAFQIMASSGDPKKTQAGQELLTSAVAGLLLLILGIFFLNAIGIGIFGLTQIGT